MNRFRVFLDLDDVLVDFVGAAARVHGTTIEVVQQKWPPGTWGMDQGMGMTGEQFRKPIDEAGEDFWANLEPLPWYDEMIKVVETYLATEWILCTSAGLYEHAYRGKLTWIQKKFGATFNKFIITDYKFMFANPMSVLIDDKEEACVQFTMNGGRALLFPRHWNSLYEESKHSPVAWLRQYMRVHLGLTPLPPDPVDHEEKTTGPRIILPR